MSYSCSDFTDDILNALAGLGLLDKEAIPADEPWPQSLIAVKAINDVAEAIDKAEAERKRLLEALRAVMAHPHVTAYFPYDPKDSVFLAAMAALRDIPPLTEPPTGKRPATAEGRTALAREVFESVNNAVDSLREDYIGAELAYVLGAILDQDPQAFVDWNLSYSGCDAARELFRLCFPPAHPVWEYILLGDDRAKDAEAAAFSFLEQLSAAQLLAKFPEMPRVEPDSMLRDWACPNCGARSRFAISFRGTCYLRSDGSEDTGDHEWEADSPCVCLGCDHRATVADFTFEGLDDLIEEVTGKGAA